MSYMTLPVEPSLYCLSLRRYARLEYQPNIVLSEKEYNVVGKHPVRPDGVAKVTGRATYGADIRLPGMLYGKILRSPYALPALSPLIRAMLKNSRGCMRR
jgi:hypothetical protein